MWRLTKNQDGVTVLQKKVASSQPGSATGWETVAQGKEIAEMLNILDMWEIEP
jgi:hypothetical protein